MEYTKRDLERKSKIEITNISKDVLEAMPSLISDINIMLKEIGITDVYITSEQYDENPHANPKKENRIVLEVKQTGEE